MMYSPINYSTALGKGDAKLYFLLINSNVIEWFSNDCRKTKTKIITPTNHSRSRQSDEPITILSNYL